MIGRGGEQLQGQGDMRRRSQHERRDQAAVGVQQRTAGVTKKTFEDRDGLALWIASFTKAGCGSAGCGEVPPYWNLDAEEDVVRTPLSEESLPR